MIKIQPITNARVPIVKFVDPTTRTNCDVNTNHVLGIHNSELIRCYTMIDDRVRPFLYSLKALVKKHGINDSSQAWLSSYAYVMMAIGFLQAQVRPSGFNFVRISKQDKDGCELIYYLSYYIVVRLYRNHQFYPHCRCSLSRK